MVATRGAASAPFASVHPIEDANHQRLSHGFAPRSWRPSRRSFKAAALWKDPQTETLPLHSTATTSYPLARTNSRTKMTDFSYSEPFALSQSLEAMVHSNIVEIVKNLKDAPFFRYVYKNPTTAASRPTLQKLPELTMPECWNYVKESVLDVAPDGLIFVQRLDPGMSRSVRRAKASTIPAVTHEVSDQGCTEQGLCLYRAGSSPRAKQVDDPYTSASDDLWGVLVQSKHGEACYILQTTRVYCPGIGAACTRFCLTKAQQFGPSLQTQLENIWLIR